VGRIVKKYRFLLIAIIAGALCYRLFFYGDEAKQAAAEKQGAERFPYPTDNLKESHSENILPEIESGRIDLALELIKLRQDCGVETDACHDSIRELINDLPAKDKARLLEIYDKYLQFEKKMRDNPPANFANLDNVAKYKLMKKARRDFFGEETAKLIFGFEEARIALQEEQQKLNSPEYANLPLPARMKLFDEKKKEILGNYHQTALEREPSDIKYGTELMFSQQELARMSDADRAKATHDLRVKHFGQAQADRITHQEQVEAQAFAESNSKMDQFLTAEKEFNKANAGLSDDARLAAIEELRKRILDK